MKGTQLSPEAVVNNGGDKRRCNERQGYLALCTDLEGVVIFAGFMPFLSYALFWEGRQKKVCPFAIDQQIPRKRQEFGLSLLTGS